MLLRADQTETAKLPASNLGFLEGVLAFKSLYTLNDISKDRETGKPALKATHYCCVLIQGRDPYWGIWQVSGQFQAFAGSRDQIEKRYPKKAWKRVMASWALTNAEDDYKDVKKRVKFLEENVHASVPRALLERTHDEE